MQSDNLSKGKSLTPSPRNQDGVTLLEVLIAITVTVIGFVGLVKLIGPTTINADYLKDLSLVNQLAITKSTELMDKLDILSATIPAGQNSIGSVASARTVDGFHDIFDESGKPLCPADANGKPDCRSISQQDVRAYIRQWKVVKDFPAAGDLSVFVSVSHTTSKKVMRSVFQTRTESVLKQ